MQERLDGVAAGLQHHERWAVAPRPRRGVGDQNLLSAKASRSTSTTASAPPSRLEMFLSIVD